MATAWFLRTLCYDITTSVLTTPVYLISQPPPDTAHTGHSTPTPSSMHTQSQASSGGLQLLDINSAFLDSLVLDFLAEEDFVEVTQPQTAVSAVRVSRVSLEGGLVWW